MTTRFHPDYVDLDRLFLGLLYPRIDWLAVCHHCLTVIYHDPHRSEWLHLDGMAHCRPARPGGPTAAPLNDRHRTATLTTLDATRYPRGPDRRHPHLPGTRGQDPLPSPAPAPTGDGPDRAASPCTPAGMGIPAGLDHLLGTGPPRPPGRQRR